MSTQQDPRADRKRTFNLGSTKTFVAVWAIVAVIVGSLVVGIPGDSEPATAAGGPIAGTVFVDYDRDGRLDSGEQSDAALAGLTVTATDAAGGVATATTAADGSYTLNTSSLAGTQFRIEFQTPTGYWPTYGAAFGTSVPDSATDVQFVDASAAVDDVVYGIVPTSECPTEGTGAPSGESSGGNQNVLAGKLWTTCFVNGSADDTSGPQDVLVGVNYDASGYPGDLSDRDNAGPNPEAEHLSNKPELGSVWGVAYDEWDGQLFTSAVVKRHVGLGPEGVDGLYWMQYQNGTGGYSPTVNSVSLDSLSPTGAPSFGADPATCPSDGSGNYDYSAFVAGDADPGGAFDCRDLGGPLDQSFDFWAFDRSGRWGIGDIDVTPDGNTLLVMNLTAKALFVYDITSGTPVYSTHVPITDGGCADGDFAPWAVTAIDADRAYIGLSCTASTSGAQADLEGRVVEVTFAGAPAQSTVSTITFDYDHGCGWEGACGPNDGNFRPWLDSVALPPISEMGAIRDPDGSGVYRYVSTTSYEQAILSDIEIDPADGSLALGVASRWGLQLGTYNCDLDPSDAAFCGVTHPAPPVADYDGDGIDDAVGPYSPGLEAVVTGDLLRICNTSSDPDAPVFVAEGGAGCDPSSFSPVFAPPYGGGPAGAYEWYWNDQQGSYTTSTNGHPETSQGGVYIADRSTEVVYTGLNPITSHGAGLTWDANVDGAAVNEFQIFRSPATFDGTLNKAQSLGDVEGCSIPLEIGNRVWLDLDGDGVQDAGEAPLAGVTVTLFAADGTTVIATTTTDANGNYYFDSTDGLAPNTDYIIDFDVTTLSNAAVLPAGMTVADLVETVADNAGNDDIDSDVVSGQIAVTTGAPGENDHSFDAGYTVPFDLALTKAVDLTSVNSGTRTATFDLTIVNQGQTVEDIDVVDYLDATIWLPFNASQNPSGTTADVDLDGDGTADLGSGLAYTWTAGANPVVSLVGVLPGGESVTVPITLTWVDPLPTGVTTLENWAEIANFDDGDASTGDAQSGALVDADSTPDSTDGNDPAPTGPGAPGDDEVDGDGSGADPVTGDEDDHDVAGFVPPPNYDLALAKVLTGFDPDTTEATYTITIQNQGAGPSGAFEVTDELPAGMSFVSADNAGAETAAGSGVVEWAIPATSELAAGASMTLTLVAQVDDLSQGPFTNIAEISSDSGSDDDSTPDDVLSGAGSDNLVDVTDPSTLTMDTNTNTPDEDDHDVAVLDLYELGNVLWFDTDNSGTLDVGESSVGAGVTVNLLDSNGVIVATTTTDANGEYSFTHLLAGDYVVEIPASNFASGGPLEGWTASTGAGASTDPDDDVDDNSDGVDQADGSVASGTVTLGSTEPTNESDESTTGTPDANSNLTVDFGFSQPTFDLALEKVFTFDTSADGNGLDGILAPGDEAVFTISVTNQGSSDATDIVVVDTIPAGFTLAAASDPLWDTVGATGTVDATVDLSGQPTAGVLASGDIATIAITLVADATASGTLTNNAEIFSADDDGDAATAAPTDVDSQPEGVEGDGTADPTIDGEIGDDGTNDEDDHDPASVTVSTAPVFDLALEKVFTSDTSADGNATDGVVQLGDEVTFTIEVFNQGTSDATDIVVVDMIPAGFNLAAGSDPLWDSVGATGFVDAIVDLSGEPTAGVLAPGDSATIDITLVATGPAVGVSTNDAEIFSADDDGDAATPAPVDVDSVPEGIEGNAMGDLTIDGELNDDGTNDEDDHDPAPVTVVAASVFDLALEKVFTSDTSADGNATDAILAPGDEVTFTIEVFNQGSSDATDIVVVDMIPAGFSLAAASDPLWDAAGATGTVDATVDLSGEPTAGVLASGDSATIAITLVADATADGSLTNNAEIFSADDDSDAATAAPADVDSQPEGVEGDGTADPTIDGELNDDGTNDEDDQDPASVTVSTAPVFDLALEKVFTSDTSADGNATDGVVQLGDEVTFTIEVFNQGTSDATDIVVVDMIPAGFSLAASSDPLWDAVGATGTVDAIVDLSGQPTAGVLAPGDSATIAITLVVDSAAVGSSTNNAEIFSADDDGDAATAAPTDVDSQPEGIEADGSADPTIDGELNDDGTNDEDDQDPASVTVASAPVFDLALEKVFTSDTSADGNATDGVVQIGDEVTFTIEVFNQGTADAREVVVVDIIPAGFSLAAASDPLWDAAGATGTVDALLDLSGQPTAGVLAPGDSATIAITLMVDSAAVGTSTNNAEIFSADDDGDPVTPAPTDTDSQPEGVEGDGTADPTVDGEINDDGATDEDDHDPASVTVEAVPVFDLALLKSVVSAGPFGPGDPVVFEVTVFNQGDVAAGDVVVTDTFGAGWVFDPADPVNAGWVAVGSTASTTVSALAANDGAAGGADEVSVQIALQIDPDFAGATLFNFAEISDDGVGVDVDSVPDDVASNDVFVDDVVDGDAIGDPGADEDDHDPAVITVVQPEPVFDLALEKVFTSDTSADGNATDGVVQIGDEVTFTIEVFNQGTSDATDIVVVDMIPAGFSLAASSDPLWDAVGATGTVDAIVDLSGQPTAGVLAPGDSATIAITLVVDSAAVGSSTNNAEIFSADDDGDAATAAPTDVDSQPEGIEADGSADLTIDGVVSDDGTNDEDDHDPASVTVEAAPVLVYDLALTKVLTGAATVVPGASVTFVIDVFNQGDVATGAGGVTITDYLPAGWVLDTAASPDWVDNNDGTASITLANSIGAGGSTFVSISLIAPATEGSFTNWAEISADDAADSGLTDADSTPDTTNGETTESPVDDVTDGTNGDEDDHDPATVTVEAVPVFDLALLKSVVSAGPFGPGDPVVFEVTVFNQGDVAAGDVVVTDTFGAGWVFDPADPVNAGWVAVGSTASTTVSALAANDGAAGGADEVSVQIALQIDPAFAGATLFNFAEISDDGVGVDVDSVPDDVASNDVFVDDVVDGDAIGDPGADEDDHDPAVITVVQPEPVFDLALEKVFTSDTSADGNATDGVVQIGDEVTFTIEVFNQGSADATDIVVVDMIPNGFSLAASSDPLWDSVGATGTVDAIVDLSGQPTAGVLAAGDSATIVITLVADAHGVGVSVNDAEIFSADDDGDAATPAPTDVDSVPEGVEGNAMGDPTIDGVVSDDGTNDEDDHDPASVTVEAAPVLVYDLALTKVLTGAATVVPGASVTFVIDVFNQGDVATGAGGVTITDYLPAGWVLDTAASPDWVDNNDGTASITLANSIGAGGSTFVSISLIAPATEGSFTNWAEISADDAADSGLTDADSTPDTTNGETTESPVDDVTDGTNGDEDDHDPATVTVEAVPVETTTTTSTTEPVATTSTTEQPTTTTSTTEPVATTSTTEPVATTSTTEPIATTSTTEPVATTSTTEPLATTSTTEPLATTSTTEPIATTSTTEPVATTSTTEPVATTSTTSTTQPVATTSTTSTTQPVATTSTTQPVATTSTTQPVATTSTTQPVATTSTTSTTSTTAPDLPVVADDENLNNVAGTSVTVDLLGNDGATIVEVVGLIDPATGDIAPDGTVEVPGEGTWTLADDGTVTFVPESGFAGNPTPLDYQATDAAGNTEVAKVTVTYLPVVADDQDLNNVAGTSVTVDLLGNDGTSIVEVVGLIDPATGNIAPDGVVEVPGEGTWTLADDGTVTFQPESGFTGNPTPLDYQATDAAGNDEVASITVTYLPVVADDEDLNNVLGTSVTVDLLGNDGTSIVEVVGLIDPATGAIDPNGVVVVPGEGTWTLNVNGTVTFAPESAFTGNPTPLDYQAADAAGNTEVASITVTYVQGTGTLPTTRPDERLSVLAGNSVTVNPLANDDAGLDPTTVQLVNPVTGDLVSTFVAVGQGTWMVDQETGFVTFVPLAGFEGNPTPVTYSVGIDNSTERVTNQVTITYRTESTGPLPITGASSLALLVLALAVAAIGTNLVIGTRRERASHL